MAHLWRLSILLVLFVGSSAFAAEYDFRILHSEAIAPATRIVADPTVPGQSSLTFQAYGRQFDLELQPNRRLLKEQVAGYALYRGKIRGLNGSWVRLTQVGNQLHGAIWDGRDLYAIEPASAVAPISLSPPPASGTTPTVYRLSDVYLTPGSKFCGLDVGEDRKTALAAYGEVVAELTALAAAGTLSGQIQISVLGDALFAGLQTDPRAAALARMNIVDGIFSEQVGITILVPEVRIFDSSNNPFTASTVPGDLLNEVAVYRNANASIRSAGLTHLFTGRDLDGNTVGIAYLSSLCQSRNGVSLSESRALSLTSSALIAAHEIGHNFGAPHDGESGSACATSPQSFLMAPQLNGSSTFSSCSLQQMAPRIQAASCITPAQYADGALSAPNAFAVVQNEAFDYTFDVNTTGSLALNNTVATVRLFGSFAVDSATVPGGTCTSGAGAVTCNLGNVAAETTRRVTLRLRTAQVGTFNSEIVLSADNDKFPTNNRLTPQISVTAQADVRVSVNPTAINAVTRSPVSFAVTVTAGGIQSSNDVTVDVSAGSLTVQSASLSGGTCTIQTNSVSCSVGTLATGSSRRLDVTLMGTQSGNYGVSAQVAASNDGVASNNTAVMNVTLRAAADARIQASPGTFSEALVGQTLTTTVTAASIGVGTANGVVVSSPGQTGIVLDSVSAPGATCSINGAGFSCALNSMPTGTQTPIQLQLHAAQPGRYSLPIQVASTNDDGPSNNAIVIAVEARYPVDVDVVPANIIPLVETRPSTLNIVEHNLGWNRASNVVFTATFPSAVTVLGARGNNNSCSVLQNVVTCTATSPLNRDATFDLFIDVRSDVTGTHDVALTVTADGDADATNNTRTLTLSVLPLIDAALTLENTPVTALVGQTLEVPVTITGSTRPIIAAEMIASVTPWAFAVESATSDAGACTTDSNNQVRCALGDLQPFEVRHVTLRLRGLVATSPFAFPIRVTAANDVDPTNDVKSFNFTLIDPSDAALAGNTTSVSGVVDQNFSYAFEVWVPGAHPVYDLKVSLPLPTGFSFVGVNPGSTPCTSGNGGVTCAIGTLGSGERRQIDLNLRSSAAGNFSTTATLSAFNDQQPQNNSRTLPVTISSPSSPAPAQSGGGGGGGGSFGWLSLMALSILASRNLARRQGYTCN